MNHDTSRIALSSQMVVALYGLFHIFQAKITRNDDKAVCVKIQIEHIPRTTYRQRGMYMTTFHCRGLYSLEVRVAQIIVKDIVAFRQAF